MGGRAQRTQTNKVRKVVSPGARKFAADTMMDLVTKWVARQLQDPQNARSPEVRKQLSRLLDQTQFIAEIVTGER